jgi:hypothetical protein
VADQQIGWETTGLQSSALPSDYRVPSDGPQGTNVFEVVGPRPEAVVTDVDRVTSVPQVTMADVYVNWQTDGRCHGVASFDLEPAKLSEVEFTVPSQWEIIQVRVEGLPVVATPVGHQVWRLPVGPEQLPQRIEILFAGHLAAKDEQLGGRLFPAPVPAGLPVVRSLWTIQGPATAGIGKPLLTHATAQPSQLASLRWGAASQVLARASQIASQSPPKELEAWRSGWQQRADRARAEILQSAPGWVTAAPAWHDSVSTSATASVVAGDFAASLRAPSDLRGPAVCCVLKGASASVVVDYPDLRRLDVVGRRGLAATICCLAALVFVLRRSTSLWEWFVRWPYVTGVLLGLVWWLWLTPSLLGLCIAAISVVAAIRPRRTTR